MRQEAVTVLRLDTTQHDAAAAKAATAIGNVGKAGQVSAGQTAAAMRSLPAQFTDVATQLAGGQNPLLILLQQGGQIKDQFGGIGAALRGIGTFITPTALGVGAVAALGGALLAADRDSRRLRDALLLTNNAAGITAGGLDALAASVAENSKTTVGGAREIALTLAEQGSVSAKVLDSMTLAVARVADVTGRQATEVARDFGRMSTGVAEWAAEHNKAWNFITADQYRYIKQLEEQGRAEEAMILVNQRLTDQLQQQQGDLGAVESAWVALGKAASTAWQQILNVGRDRGTTGRIQDAEVALTQARRAQGSPLLELLFGSVADAQAELEAALEVARLESRSIGTRAANLAGEREAIAKERATSTARNAKAAAAAREAARIAEKAFDRTPPLAGLEYLDRSDRLELAGRPGPDPLGDFIGQRVLPAAQTRQRAEEEQRLDRQQALLQDLVSASKRANVELIADDRQRAEAQIALDREALQQRINAIFESGPDRAAAEAAADATAAARLQSITANLSRDSAKDLREQTRNALAAAFQDSQNPAKAFAQSLGNIIFQRVTNSLADALANALVGANGSGGLFGPLLGALFGGGGGIPGGDSIWPGGAPLPDILRGGAATGSNYIERDMLTILHKGEAVVPKRYNPAAGGTGGGSVTINQTFNVQGGASRADMVAAAEQARRAAVATVADMMSRGNRAMLSDR